jgi:hypothetical protein
VEPRSRAYLQEVSRSACVSGRRVSNQRANFPLPTRIVWQSAHI